MSSDEKEIDQIFLLPFLNIKYIEKNLGRGKCYKLFYFKVVLNHLKCERESVTKQDSSYAYSLFTSLDSTADKKIKKIFCFKILKKFA